MEEAAESIVSECKALVRSIARAEAVVIGAQEGLSREALAEAFGEVLRWLQTTEELPTNSLSREVAREIIGALSSIVALKGFEGSPGTYIA